VLSRDGFCREGKKKRGLSVAIVGGKEKRGAANATPLAHALFAKGSSGRHPDRGKEKGGKRKLSESPPEGEKKAGKRYG